MPRAIRVGVRFAILFTLGLWLVDAAVVFDLFGDRAWQSLFDGLLSAWFAAATPAAFLAIVSSVLFALLGGPARVGAALQWPWSTRREGAEIVLIAAVFSFFYIVSIVVLSAAIERELASAGYRALANSLCAFSLGVLLIWAWAPSCRYAQSLLTDRLRVPRRFASIVLLTIGTLGAGAILGRGWQRFSLLPWDIFTQVSFAFVFAAAGLRILSLFAARRADLVLFSCVVGLFAVGAWTGISLSNRDTVAVAIAQQTTLTGRIGTGALRLWADRDGDGQLSVLGDGDCAPDDASRHLGAVDVPSNGIDEDCSGSDLVPLGVVKAGRSDWPVPSSVPKRPSIVLITIDALSPRHLSARGYGRETTPQLDRWIESGAYFSSAFAQGPSTRLSFPSLFTSSWDSQLDWDVKGRQPYPFTCRACQLAEFMASAGYDTTAVLSEAYFGRRKWPSITRGFKLVRNESEKSKARVSAEQITSTTLALLEEKLSGNADKPIFAWAHYYDIHSPYQQPPEALQFGSATIDKYDGQLRVVDREVGRLIEGVRAVLPNALIVVTSDHATVFHPKPKLRKKKYGFDLHTDTLHVPLLFLAPWIPKAVHDGAVSLMDVTPTLVNLAGLKLKRELYGESLVPEIFDGVKRERVLFHQYHLPERSKKGKHPIAHLSVRTDTHNLIVDRRRGTQSLYAWRDDYHELHNLLDGAAVGPDVTTIEKLETIAQSYLYELGIENELGSTPARAIATPMIGLFEHKAK